MSDTTPSPADPQSSPHRPYEFEMIIPGSTVRAEVSRYYPRYPAHVPHQGNWAIFLSDATTGETIWRSDNYTGFAAFPATPAQAARMAFILAVPNGDRQETTPAPADQSIPAYRRLVKFTNPVVDAVNAGYGRGHAMSDGQIRAYLDAVYVLGKIAGRRGTRTSPVNNGEPDHSLIEWEETVTSCEDYTKNVTPNADDSPTKEDF